MQHQQYILEVPQPTHPPPDPHYLPLPGFILTNLGQRQQETWIS